MKNLINHKKLENHYLEQNSIISSHVYIHGIAQKYFYDNNGEIMFDNNNSPKTGLTLNFESKLTRVSTTPSLANSDNFLFIEWENGKPFDYIGLAVICDEVVFVNGFDKVGVVGNSNEIRIHVERGVNGTKFKDVLYPESSIIRSVVKITQNLVSYNFSTRSEVMSNNLFSPVVDTATFVLDDETLKWANYYDNKEFALRRHLALYVFNGTKDELVCEYVGFIDKFNIGTTSVSLSITCKDKLSLYWENEITAHKTYSNITIADFLSDILQIPRNFIIYPQQKYSGITYDSKLKLHTWKNSIYTDDDFFKIDVLSTKEFETYSDLIRAATQELMFRMKFDTYERLVIQSDVFISNKEIIYDDNLSNNYVTITDNDDIYEIEQTTDNQVIINKIEGDFIERNTFYDKNDFKLNHLTFDVYFNNDKTSGVQTSFEEHQIYNPDSLDNRTSESPFIIDSEGNKVFIQVAVIKSDSQYNNKDTWYRWSVIKHSRNDSVHGQIPSVSWGWVFKGYAEKFRKDDDYLFTEQVKYSKNKKILNASVMKYDPSNVPEFSVLTVLGKKDTEGNYERKYKIPIGNDIKHVQIGDYVMITDGVLDFMGKISDKEYGLTTLATEGNIIRDTYEQTEKVQKFRIIDSNMDNVLDVRTSTGDKITDYKFDKTLHLLTGTVSSNVPYHTYSNPHTVNKVQEYGESIQNSILVTQHFSTPFAGDYTGNLSLNNKDNSEGTWEWYGEESIYKSNTTDYLNVTSVISNDGIRESYEYRTVVSNIVHTKTDYYKKYYNVFKRQQRRLLKTNLVYSGNLFLNTYKYQIHVYTQKLTINEDENKINESTITVMCGYDKDYPMNYKGRHEYLENLGYVNKPMDLQLFYIRNEYPYVWEMNRDEKTSTMNFPILPIETREINGNFGGIDSGEKKYAGIVDDIQSLYGSHFGKYHSDNITIPAYELLYSREYHQPIPLYVRSNKIKPHKLSNGDSIFYYDTFDNRNLAVTLSSTAKKYEESDDFAIQGLFEQTSGESDFAMSISNMQVSPQCKYSTNRESIAFYIDSNNKKIEITIPKETSLTLLSWTDDDIKKYTIDRYYKISNPLSTTDNNSYYISKTYCDSDFEKVSIEQVYGKKAIRIKQNRPDGTSYNWNVGDVIILDRSNEKNINTQVIYNKYSDSRWQITMIERGYNDTDSDLIFLDYEFPVGENNAVPIINKFDYNYIIMLQEVGMKGNPYTEEIHSIHYENKTSVEIYGEYPYDGISGQFISMKDLNTALSYIINGFSGTEKDNTKFVFPIKMDSRFELELFDTVRIKEQYYTGLDNQTGIIVGKTHTFNESDVATEYTVMTLGKYEITDDVSIKGNQNYEPVELPEYSEDGSTGQGTVNLNNVAISKYDKELGNVMLLQIASDNLSAKVEKGIESEDRVLNLYNITSYFDNTENLSTKKYYTDLLLDKGQQLFIKINGEFMYAKVVDAIKETQSYLLKTNKKEDENNSKNVEGIVTKATLQLKNRGTFETPVSNIDPDSKVELYQITSMVNGDGAYSSALTIGDKVHREYFEFSVKDGIDITTGRGKILISTNDDWHMQAKNILYNHYGEELVNELDENGVVDKLGKGVLQIGKSASSQIENWKADTEYIVDNYCAFKNFVYKCIQNHTSKKLWSETEGYWEYQYPTLEHAQYLRYSPLGGLELKGAVDIDSGSFKINELYNSTNFMHLTDSYGILGIGVKESYFNPDVRLDKIKSFVQIGDFKSNNGLIFYSVVDNDSKFAIRTKDLSINLFRPETNVRYGSLVFTPDEQYITMNEDGKSLKSKFQIGAYTGKNLAVEENHFYYETFGNESKLSLKVNQGWIGNERSFIFFDKNRTIAIDAKYQFETKTARDEYFGIYDKAQDLIVGGTYDGNLDFATIIERSTKNIKTYIIADRVYQYYDYEDNSWKDYHFDTMSMLYLNSGMQQLGNVVRDTDNEDGYSGLYVGYANEAGVGDTLKGQYIKFDGRHFQIGHNITMFYRGQAIKIGDLIDGSVNNNLEGTTVFNENVIVLHKSNKLKYVRPSYNGIEISVRAKYDTNLIRGLELYPPMASINNIASIHEGILVKFVNLENGDKFECKITHIEQDGSFMNISKVFPETANYELWVEDPNHVLMTIGDLTDRTNVGELIRFGHGVAYDPKEDEYAVGLHMISNSNKSYFKYDSLRGLNMLSEDGLINFKNLINGKVANELLFDKYNNSLISMNQDTIQMGTLRNISFPELSSFNGQKGLFLGDYNNKAGYLAYSTEQGLRIKGSFILDTDENIKDHIDNVESGLNDKVNQEINNIQALTVYKEKPPVNVIWKWNSVYKLYNIDTNSWNTISLSLSNKDTSKLYRDEHEKYFIYNTDSSEWISVQIIEQEQAPSQIAKEDTLWVSTINYSMYRYRNSFTYEKRFDINYTGQNQVTYNFDLKNFGVSNYQLTFNVSLSSIATITVNDYIIDNVGNGTKVVTIPYNVLKNGSNNIVLKLKTVNNTNVTLVSMIIKSVGLIKWNAVTTPQEIVTDSLNGTRATVFILSGIPKFKKFKTLTGTISTTSGKNVVTGIGTKFMTEVKVGDLIYINDKEIYTIKSITDNTNLVTNETFWKVYSQIKFMIVDEVWEAENEEKKWISGNPNKLKAGDVARSGEMLKQGNTFYATRELVSSVKEDGVYTVTEKTYRLYPNSFDISDIREQYDYNPDIKIKFRDTIYVLNYYGENESATFIYFPQNADLRSERSIMDTSLDNIDTDDFVITSSLNDKQVFIQTDKSKLLFTSDPFTYDEIQIAATGAYGRFLIGKANSSNFMRFDSELGLDIATGNTVNITENGALNINKGTLQLKAQSTLDLSAGSNFNIVGAYVNIHSDSRLNLESSDMYIDNKSNVTISSKTLKIDLSGKDEDGNYVSPGAFTMNVPNGNVLVNNTYNELFFNATNKSSRLILNKEVSRVSSEVILQLGDHMYYNGTTLKMNNTEISLTGANNQTIITPEHIVSSNSISTSTYNDDYGIEYVNKDDYVPIQNEYFGKKLIALDKISMQGGFVQMERSYNVIKAVSVDLKRYKEEDLIQLDTSSIKKIMLISEDKKAYNISLKHIMNDKYVVLTENYVGKKVKIVIYNK